MVKIDDFFGLDKLKKTVREPNSHIKAHITNEQARKRPDAETPPAKRAKTEDPETTTPKSSKFFDKKSDKKPAVVELDSENDDFKPDDDDIVELDDAPEAPKRALELPSRAKKAKKVKKEATPIILGDEEMDSVKEKTATPKKTHSSPKKATTKKATASALTGLTAEQVLEKIPDAELPEEEEGDGKFNYHAAQAKKANGIQSSGEAVEIGEAQPNCLSGLTIVFTGVLPKLDRDASENLAKRYGARVTKSILGKTSLVVIGSDAGPSKIKKIKQHNIKAIDEDGFVQLLNSMPAEGGDGDAALKAKEKREAEEKRIEEEAEAAEAEERAREAAERKKEKQRALMASKGDSDRPQPEAKRVIPNSEKLWTVKHAPTELTQLCGNKGQINKLKEWLSNWAQNARAGFKGSDSGAFRAALISGPPGIGKTSAAHLVAKQLGFDILEKNASDVRSKSLLNSSIKSVLNNTSVVGFFSQKDHNANSKKFCLIMDEVDGMSSGDHGGAGALAAFCRTTNMPMILICNDKLLPKMRPFDRVTYDLPFRRPSEVEVKARLMTIAHREKIKLDPTVIGQLVEATHNDIRQMINILLTVSTTQKKIGHEESAQISKSWQKQTVLKPFDIAGKLLSSHMHSGHSDLNARIDLYFNDIDFTPLMIQENYISTRPSGVASSLDHLKRVAQAADDISQLDGINSLIRSLEQQWSLLPFHAVMSSVKPSMEVAGNMSGRMAFSAWLGQNSKTMKYQRLLQELQYHARLRTSADKSELRLQYMPLLVKRLTDPLVEQGEGGIDAVMAILDHYYLTKEDWESLVDFGVGPAKADTILKKVLTKTKTAFTRKYNAMSHPVAIYKTGNSVGSNRGGPAAAKADFEDVIVDDTNLKEEEEEEKDDGKFDAKKDKLIKEVKPKKRATKKKK